MRDGFESIEYTENHRNDFGLDNMDISASVCFIRGLFEVLLSVSQQEITPVLEKSKKGPFQGSDPISF